MTSFSQLVDNLTEVLGRALAWLTGMMAILTFLVVVLRYAFDQGAVALQESVMYMHGLVFMLGIPYALKNDVHVRVDLIYSRLGTRQRAWVDLVGHLIFLLPVSGFIFYTSLPYVAASWRVLEGSSEVGGIPAVYLLKTLIPVMAALLVLQGVSGMVKQVLIIRQIDGQAQ